MTKENYKSMKNFRGISNLVRWNSPGRNFIENGSMSVPLERGHVYTEADLALIEGRSIGKNVRETILKNGLDYIIEEARKGEDVGDALWDGLGRVYDSDFKYTWHPEYQDKAMDAMKKGGLF
jgi:hypothetical protein